MTFVPAYTPIDDLDQFDSNRLPFLRIQSNSPAVTEDRPNVEIKIQKQFATSTIHANLIGVHEQPGHWLWETAESLGTLLTLEDNWDSYGAKSVSPETILATFELLIAIMDDHSPRASIVPTPMGNVQIECTVPELISKLRSQRMGNILCCMMTMPSQRNSMKTTRFSVLFTILRS